MTGIPFADSEQEVPTRKPIDERLNKPASWDYGIDTVDPATLNDAERRVLKTRFLQIWYATGSQVKAAKKCGLRRATILGWVKEDPGFAEEIQDVKDSFGDDAVAIAVQIARNPKASERARVTASAILGNTFNKDFETKKAAAHSRGNVVVNLIVGPVDDQADQDNPKQLPPTADYEIVLDDSNH